MIKILYSILECKNWISNRIKKGNYSIKRVPLNEIEGWGYNKNKKTFSHKSGKFFSVNGLQYKNNIDSTNEWQQPIIIQPEKGILGYAYTVLNHQRYFLIQAKLEPGNPGLIQVSPTLQATKSNLTRVHAGNTPKYTSFFIEGDKNKVKTKLDVSLSETASRFLSKRNINIIVELINPNYDHVEEFALLPEQVICQLMFCDNMVNMDARSILSLILGGYGTQGKARKLVNWLRNLRKKFPSEQNIIPLKNVSGWLISDEEMSCAIRNEFRVIGIKTEAPEREVPFWTQPILAHDGLGICGIIVSRIDGKDYYLLQAKPEPGCGDFIELAPTVSYFDFNGRLAERKRIPFAMLFEDRKKMEWSVRNSEEGGRFDHYENDFCLLRVENFKEILPINYKWATFEEMKSANLEEGVVNSELRTIIALLGAKKDLK